jgi:hypothetical protein
VILQADQFLKECQYYEEISASLRGYFYLKMQTVKHIKHIELPTSVPVDGDYDPSNMITEIFHPITPSYVLKF